MCFLCRCVAMIFIELHGNPEGIMITARHGNTVFPLYMYYLYNAITNPAIPLLGFGINDTYQIPD